MLCVCSPALTRVDTDSYICNVTCVDMLIFFRSFSWTFRPICIKFMLSHHLGFIYIRFESSIIYLFHSHHLCFIVRDSDYVVNKNMMAKLFPIYSSPGTLKICFSDKIKMIKWFSVSLYNSLYSVCDSVYSGCQLSFHLRAFTRIYLSINIYIWHVLVLCTVYSTRFTVR